MTPFRRALIGLGIAGAVIGILMTVVTITSNHEEDRGLDAALALTVTYSFLFTGLVSWDRRPTNLIGPLMVAVGFTWFLTQIEDSNLPGLFAVGLVWGSLPFGFLLHMLWSYPSGRLTTKAAKLFVPLGYACVGFLPFIAVFFLDPSIESRAWSCDDCPPNPLLIDSVPAVVTGVYLTINFLGVVAIAALVTHIVGRARRADPRERRRDAPVWWAGGITLIALAMLLVVQLKGKEDLGQVLFYFAMLALASVPVAFWLGGFRVKLSEADEVAAENVRLDAELQARLDELRESRARIVEAADSARRKLERDLHDGAQQRLVGLALDLRLARSKLEGDPDEAARMLDEAQAELARATDELRELARGIHPAVLSDRGLGAAVDALAARCPLPVPVESDLRSRLPGPVEAAAYFVVAEALTNVVRHAGAERASVTIRDADGSLAVAVSDDGQGGADAAGSGLRGLADRISALDGELEIDSPPGRGTIVRARIPLTTAPGLPPRVPAGTA